MYNGVGLTTPRGSGSSGHVQSNKSHLRAASTRERVERNQQQSSDGSSRAVHSHALLKRANDELIEHVKKRKVEATIFELQEAMEEQGYTPAEIQSKVALQRAELEGQSTVTGSTDTHSVAIEKAKEDQRLRSAFGINDDHVHGESFNEEAVLRRKAERIRKREEQRLEREAERAKVKETHEPHNPLDHTDSSKRTYDEDFERGDIIVQTEGSYDRKRAEPAGLTSKHKRDRG